MPYMSGPTGHHHTRLPRVSRLAQQASSPPLPVSLSPHVSRPAGTITCLQFHGRHHLLSGSEDGRVAVVRTDNWQCEKYLGRHKGGVTALAVHPSGRLALSAGKDGKLLTWDLVRGRVAFRTNIKAGESSTAVGAKFYCEMCCIFSI